MSAATAERRAPVLAAVDEGYLVGRRWPLSELASEQQEQIRKAYADTGWSSDFAVEWFGFYTDLTLAQEEAAKYAGGFVQTLPVNASYGPEHRRAGLHLFPNSDAREWYEETSPGLCPLLGVDRNELERINCELRAHARELQSIAL